MKLRGACGIKHGIYSDETELPVSNDRKYGYDDELDDTEAEGKTPWKLEKGEQNEELDMTSTFVSKLLS
ncbi:hypothetical protein INR49_021647 [Caranx melampygus]|nr:hypothetical protein INR49_021647 [Caranx melampygus]